MSITKDMKISEIIEKHPVAAQVMMSHGMGCVGCAMSSNETLEQGAKSHGFNDEQVDKIVKEINSLIEENKE